VTADRRIVNASGCCSFLATPALRPFAWIPDPNQPAPLGALVAEDRTLPSADNADACFDTRRSGISGNQPKCGALLRSGCKGDTSPPRECCTATLVPL